MNTQQLPGKYQVNAAIVINSPSSELWTVLKDFGNVSNWAPSVTKSYYLDSTTSGVGTGRHCDIQGFGSIEETITEWNEGQGFTYSVTPLGPLDTSHSSWTISEIDKQTSKLEVILSYDIRFGLFGKLLHAIIMRKKLEKALPETVLATKKYVESLHQAEPHTQNLAAAS